MPASHRLNGGNQRPAATGNEIGNPACTQILGHLDRAALDAAIPESWEKLKDF
ncbi:hypothetical protein ShzoTeo12_20300 [Shinella zoogloeoides]|nr:hypothetical protein ShzoTeo12_20300 [Shinella zoogloeoides]